MRTSNNRNTAFAGTVRFHFEVQCTLLNRICLLNFPADAGPLGDKDQGHDKIDFRYIRRGVINI